MKFYIFPSQKETFDKKFQKIAKFLKVPPTVTYSEPMTKVKTTIYNGFEYHKKVRNTLEVIEVNIDLAEDNWILVATVYFSEGRIALINQEHFQDIPAHLGLGYKKCDACGHSHSNRLVSHIFYNTDTKEWKQVGSECAKMVFGTALDKFITRLYEVIEVCFGVLDPDKEGSWAKIPNHYFQEALHADTLLTITRQYRREKNPIWKKTAYDAYNNKIPGTTDFLNAYFNENAEKVDVDTEFASAVREFVKTLPEGDFNDKIRQSLGCDYIPRHSVFTAFFAVKLYEESLDNGWKDAHETHTIDEYYDLIGAQLLSHTFVNDIYGCYYLCKFLCNGIIYSKTISALNSLDKYKKEDGTFSFSAKVYRFEERQHEVKLGGRLRLIK